MPRQLKEGDAVGECPECKSNQLIVRRNRKSGELFIGCGGYPTCNYTMNTNDYHEPGDFSWVK